LGWSKNLSKIFIRIKINYVLNKNFVNIINYVLADGFSIAPVSSATGFHRIKKLSMNA